jgi:hypothetical protein
MWRRWRGRSARNWGPPSPFLFSAVLVFLSDCPSARALFRRIGLLHRRLIQLFCNFLQNLFRLFPKHEA